ncbi:MAG: aldehyde dehydrogenase (NADP(+)) [Flavobacteriaceae bacterium]
METTFQAVNPATNEQLEGVYVNTPATEIDAIVQKAKKAFLAYRQKSGAEIALFLEQCAQEIEDLGERLLERCHRETALPMGRLQGERGRTTGQLRLFASVVREGSWVDARIDTAQPNRQPFPRADIRHMLIPLGPVAVFGASNFPLAFSTAGGDTASALAAGCPVIVKGHPAHPGTAQLVADALIRAAEKTGMPEGTVSIIHGTTVEVGKTLVEHPALKAVGFTGSFRGGKAIFDYANARPEPIPVFAEMGSTNPVFILPGALKEKGEQIGAGLSASINLGTGQFCTNPGLSFVMEGEGKSAFMDSLGKAITNTEATTMLSPGIKSAYDTGLQRYENDLKLDALGTGKSGGSVNQATSKVFKAPIADFLRKAALEEENFGPSSIVVEAHTKEEILKAAQKLTGHLTATVHATQEDMTHFKELFQILEQKVGRVVVNGYPTGVEVCHSMVHGGPFPATTAPQTTSVGTNAIKRFVRPVCYQDYPQELLPSALKNENPLGIFRLVDGTLTKSPLQAK